MDLIFVEVNGKTYLAKPVDAEGIYGDAKPLVAASFTKAELISYLKEANLEELSDICSTGGVPIITRSLSPSERLLVSNCVATFEQAKYMALAYAENRAFDILIGESRSSF